MILVAQIIFLYTLLFCSCRFIIFGERVVLSPSMQCLPSFLVHILKIVDNKTSGFKLFHWQCDALDICWNFDGLNEQWIYSFFFKSSWSKESNIDSVSQNCWGWKELQEVIWSSPMVSPCKSHWAFARPFWEALGIGPFSYTESWSKLNVALSIQAHFYKSHVTVPLKTGLFSSWIKEFFSKNQSWYTCPSVNSKWKLF